MAPAGTRFLAGAGCGAPVAGRLVLLPAPLGQAGTNRSASGQRAVTIPRALVWLWCDFGFSIEGLPLAYQMALGSHWCGLGWLARRRRPVPGQQATVPYPSGDSRRFHRAVVP